LSSEILSAGTERKRFGYILLSSTIDGSWENVAPLGTVRDLNADN